MVEHVPGDSEGLVRPTREPDGSNPAGVVLGLLGLLRSSRLYDISNQSLQQQVEDFLGRVSQAMDGELTLVAMGQAFYINGTRVRARPNQANAFERLSKEFERRQLGGLRFLSELRSEELGAFLRVWNENVDASRSPMLVGALAGAGVTHAVVITLEDLAGLSASFEESDGEAGKDERERAKEIFGRAVRGTKTALLRAAKTGRPTVRPIKRLVQPIVDAILQNEYSIVGLTAIKDHDEYTYAHCVNVSILSIGMGQQLGMSRTALADLGVAAVLHDLGKLRVPADVLVKPDRLDEAEWHAMRRHPVEGVRMLLGLPGITPLTLEMVEVCLQHHLLLDGAGYPATPERYPLSTASRIVTVADCFDALTSHRAYRARPFSGYEALRLLLAPDQRKYDPAVLWVLIKTVGLYPAGTVLLTTCGHTVVSIGSNPVDFRRPPVRVVLYPDGTTPQDEAPDVWDPLPVERSVARVMRPEELGFEVDGLMAA